MSQTMKLGLALSGGGAIGAYEAGVVKALAESGTDVHMVSGASIGALNGAIIASSSGLSQAAERMAEIWDHLGNSTVLSVNKSAYFFAAVAVWDRNGALPDAQQDGKYAQYDP